MQQIWQFVTHEEIAISQLLHTTFSEAVRDNVVSDDVTLTSSLHIDVIIS